MQVKYDFLFYMAPDKGSQMLDWHSGLFVLLTFVDHLIAQLYKNKSKRSTLMIQQLPCSSSVPYTE